MDTIKATSSVKLLDWESSHFAWSVKISIKIAQSTTKTISSDWKRQAFLVMSQLSCSMWLNLGINMMK